MKREMATDKAKNHILPISTLGIMQMTDNVIPRAIPVESTLTARIVTVVDR